MHRDPSLNRTATVLYASGSLGTGVFSTVPTVLLLFYCTEILHIPAAWAAAAVFVPKIWAIVWDPLVGFWSDNLRSCFGRRRPFLATGLLGITVFFIAVFTLPPLSAQRPFYWVAFAYFGLATTYSLFAVPYIAIPAEIGASAAARVRLVSWRMTAGMIGVLIGAGAAPLLVAYGGGGRQGYTFMSVSIALLCAVAMLGPIVMMAGRDKKIRDIRDERPTDGFAQFWGVLCNRKFSALAASYMIQLTAVGIVTSSTPYLVTRIFARGEADVGVALLVMFTTTAFFIPIWSWLGKTVSERNMLVVAAILFGLFTSLLSGVIMAGATWFVALGGFFLIGIPFAGMQVLPFTIAAHLVHDASEGTENSEGAYTGIWTAAEKLGLALGPALTGLTLSAIHGHIAGDLAKYLITAPFILVIISLPFIRRSNTRRDDVKYYAGIHSQN